MEPLLPSGTIALFREQRHVKRGDVVLVDHPEFGKIVKSVREVAEGDGVALEGLSPHSTSAEKLGSVAPDKVRGTLLKCLG